MSLQYAKLNPNQTYTYDQDAQLVPLHTLMADHLLSVFGGDLIISPYLSSHVKINGQITKSSAGLDVHKKFVVAAVVISFSASDQRLEFVQQFDVSQDGLLALSSWLAHFPEMSQVAMEATANYWKPIHHILCQSGYQTLLLNPTLLHYIDKTDVKDAFQIARLNHYNMLKASMIAGPQQEDLRRMNRLLNKTIATRTAYSNRIEDEFTRSSLFLLQHIKVLSVSGRNIINAIICGESDPAVLVQGYVGQKFRGEKEQILIDSLVHVAVLRPATHKILARLMAGVEFCDQQISEYQADIKSMISEIEYVIPLTGEVLSGDQLVELIRTAPRVGEVIAWTIIAEMGWEITRFPTAGHYASFSGFIPQQRITAGKKIKDGSKPGNSHVHSKVVQAAQGILNGWEGKIPLAEKAWQYLSRCGNKLKAVSMIGRELMQGIWHMLMKGEAWKDKQRPSQTTSVEEKEKSVLRAVRQVQELGSVVKEGQLSGDLKELVQEAMNNLAKLLGQSKTTLKMSQDYKDGQIEDLKIPRRAKTALLAAGIEKISALLALVLSENVIKRIKGVGEKIHLQIIKVLIRDGYLCDTAVL